MDDVCTTRLQEFEDLLGGRVLAWVGGFAVLVGLAFLFAIAVSNGWIDAGTRTLLGAAGSAGLLAGGIWLHERGARTDAARAAAAVGIAGLFLTVTVASQVYGLLPSLVGLSLAVAVGGVATTLAIRWQSRGIAALGVLGAVAAPLLAGTGGTTGATAILFVAMAAAAGVLLWQHWDWLALAAFALGTPQWVATLFDHGSASIRDVVTLVAFALLGIVVALGRDLRTAPGRVRVEAAFLLALNAIVVAITGWAAFHALHEPAVANGWLAGMAAVHVLIGLAGPRLAAARITEDLARLSLVMGVLLADVAFALVAHGIALPVGWMATTLAFAALMRRTARSGRDDVLAGTGLGGHLALALGTALAVDNPLRSLGEGQVPSTAALLALAVVAAGCLISARLVEDDRHVELRIVLDGVGLVVLALLTALLLDGQALVLAWSGEVATLAALARRRKDETAAWGALGFLALAAAYALALEAPPVALVTGFAEPLAAAAALGGVALAALLAGSRLTGLPGMRVDLGMPLKAVGAALVLYLASGLVVTPFESAHAVGSTLLSAHQEGQMVLSVFWALVGVGGLVAGLRRDVVALRLAALGLLGVAIVKVFLFDLATLTSIYRVVSFMALGLLLLAGALVWQRLRPSPALEAQTSGDGSSS